MIPKSISSGSRDSSRVASRISCAAISLAMYHHHHHISGVCLKSRQASGGVKGRAGKGTQPTGMRHGKTVMHGRPKLIHKPTRRLEGSKLLIFLEYATCALLVYHLPPGIKMQLIPSDFIYERYRHDIDALHWGSLGSGLVSRSLIVDLQTDAIG